jgi:hypothetical protein
MDVAAAMTWYEGYLRLFEACGRGTSDDIEALADCFGIPALLTTDDGVRVVDSMQGHVALLREQATRLRKAGYYHSEQLSAHTAPLNASTILHTATFVRRRVDASEISRLRATYLITAGASGPRISALAVGHPRS